MNRGHLHRARKRDSARGAAMVEAVIVLSTMLVFLGTIVWTRNSYAMKMDMQQETRSSSLYYASHGCSGDKGTASSEKAGSVIDSSDVADKVAQKSGVSAAAAISRTYNSAMAKTSGKSAFAAVWDASGGKGLDLKKQGLSRIVQSSSKVTCNEPQYDGGWKDWFAFASRFISGGLGNAGSLFK